MTTKRKLFHTLNERARREEREREQRERALLDDKIEDPRRKSSFSWIEPLIEDE